MSEQFVQERLSANLLQLRLMKIHDILPEAVVVAQNQHKGLGPVS